MGVHELAGLGDGFAGVQEAVMAGFAGYCIVDGLFSSQGGGWC